MLESQHLHTLERVRKALEADEPVGVSSDEINTYYKHITQLEEFGAFEYPVPSLKTGVIIETAVIPTRGMDLTTFRHITQTHRTLDCLGFTWVTVPVLVGPKKLINPREYSKQRPLLDRLKRCWQVKAGSVDLSLVFSGSLVPCAGPVTWNGYGYTVLLPRTAVSHGDYMNFRWYLLAEAEKRIV